MTTSEATDAVISHFIPSVELRGSRGDKLRKLDILILYLERLRGSLARDTTEEAVPSHTHARPPWGWFTAGIVVGAIAVLLLFAVSYWPYDFFTKS